MSECLVTKLKSAINDSNLLELGEMRADIMKASNGTIDPMITIDAYDTMEINLLADGVFDINNSTTIKASNRIHIGSTATSGQLQIKNKYNIKNLYDFQHQYEFYLSDIKYLNDMIDIYVFISPNDNSLE